LKSFSGSPVTLFSNPLDSIKSTRRFPSGQTHFSIGRSFLLLSHVTLLHGIAFQPSSFLDADVLSFTGQRRTVIGM